MVYVFHPLRPTYEKYVHYNAHYNLQKKIEKNLQLLDVLIFIFIYSRLYGAMMMCIRLQLFVNNQE